MFIAIRQSDPLLLVGQSLMQSMAQDRTFELWNGFMSKRKTIANALDTTLYSVQIFPATFDFLQFDAEVVFEKCAAVAVSDKALVPEGLKLFRIPSGLYAVFLHKGPAADGERTFRYIFEDWIPMSDYRVDDRPHFEILGSRYQHGHADSEEEIWIPIRLKNQFI